MLLPRRLLSLHIIKPRQFTCTALQNKNLPPRPKPPPDSEIEESYLKGSGPGGQKINKTNSAVQLKHVPTGIVVKSQATRSRSQNRKHARELLAQKVDDLLHGEQSRSSIVGQVKKKKAVSAAKKSRRKYRMLDENEDEDMDKEQEQEQEQTPTSQRPTSSLTDAHVDVAVTENTSSPQNDNKRP